ncbi:MAG: hypothetical protein HYY84_05640 [Deltaproteobacteria bacterium]|nr:hypothetical protein [Deltaproteobacteria bacterium]
MRAQPDIVVLGIDKRVVLEIIPGKKLKGAPRLSATAGTIGRVESQGNGRYHALYTPPKEGSPPQIVLIAFWDSEDISTLGHVTIPIHANLTMQLESAPGATVIVDVGTHRSSPAVGNAKGEVTVTVRIAPGVTKATIHTTYPNGKRTVTEDTIDVPSWNRVQLIVGGTEAFADGRSVVPVRVVAVTRSGRLMSRGVQLNSTAGRFISLGSIDGYQAATYIARPRGSAATERISASIAGDRRSFDVRTLELKPLEPYDITVSDRVERVSEKDTDARFVVLATLRSRNKIAISGERLLFLAEPDCGRPKTRELGNGRYQAVFSVPKSLEDIVRKAGKIHVKVSHVAARGATAALSNEAEFSAHRLGLVIEVAKVTKVETRVMADGTRREVTVEVPELRRRPVLPSAPPVEVGLHLKPETIRANGRPSEVVVHLFDEDGKAVLGKRLNVVASAGRVTKVVEKESGYYYAEYQPPTIVDKTRTEFPVRIRVASDDGSVGYSESISIESSLASDFPAAEKRFRLGASVGGWIPLADSLGLGVDIDFLIRLKVLDRNFSVLVSAGAYFLNDVTRSDPTSPKVSADYQGKQVFSVVGGMLYRRVVGRPWFSLHAGLAGGAYVVGVDINQGGVITSQLSLLVGFQVPFGIEFKVGPGTIPLAFRFHQTIKQQPDTNVSSDPNNVQAFTIGTGYRMEF